MAFHHAAFRQDLPATPANMPLNYVYPPPGQSSYTPQQEPDEQVRKMWEEHREWKKEEKKKEDLYNSVIEKYANIEYAKYKYQQNMKNQRTINRTQITITILQILGVAVIYFVYNYSILIFLGVIYLNYVEIKQIEKMDFDVKKMYSSFEIKAKNIYGKEWGKNMDEKLKEDRENLDKPNKTAEQIIDMMNNKHTNYKEVMVCLWIFVLIISIPIFIIMSDAVSDKFDLSNEKKNHSNDAIALNFTMCILGSLLIILKLIIQYIMNKHCCIPMPSPLVVSQLFVEEPSERQPLLTI